jgi:hypothetical protein
LAQVGSDGNNLPTDVLVSEARSRQIEGLGNASPDNSFLKRCRAREAFSTNSATSDAG